MYSGENWSLLEKKTKQVILLIGSFSIFDLILRNSHQRGMFTQAILTATRQLNASDCDALGRQILLALFVIGPYTVEESAAIDADACILANANLII